MRILLLFCFFLTALTVHAAEVNCTFTSETQISKDGQWLHSEIDPIKLYRIFGDGLVIPLENSLLLKLDSNEPFLAQRTERGSVYLRGGDFGIEGKLMSANKNIMTIYDGACTVSFG